MSISDNVTEDDALILANRYRACEITFASGGVVILFNGKAIGWMDELRSPKSWEPGCVAVDENGSQWIAAGGDSYNGAERWQPTKTQ